jgi:hypothetical protein
MTAVAAMGFSLLGAMIVAAPADGQAVQTVGGGSGGEPAVLVDTGFEPGQETPELSHHRLVTGGARTGEASVEGEVTDANQAAFLRLPFDEAAGNRLALSFWVQSDDRCRCAVWARTGKNQRTLLVAVDRLPRRWTHLTATYDAPAGAKGHIEIVTPSSHGGSPPGRARIDDVRLTASKVSLPPFASPPTESFPALTVDSAGQVWMAAIRRPIPKRQIHVCRVRDGRREQVAVLAPAGLTGIGPPALAPRKNGCLVAFAAEINDRWRIACAFIASMKTEPLPKIRYLDAGGTANIEPALAAVGNTFHVVWESNAGDARGVYAGTVTSGKVGKPVRISAAGANSVNPAVVALVDGSLFAVWDSVRNDRNDLYGAAFRDGVWGAERRITSDPRLERFASLAARGNEVWIAWQAQSFQRHLVTGLSEQRIVVAQLHKGKLLGTNGVFEAVSPPKAGLLRPRIAFDSTGRLWLSARRSKVDFRPGPKANRRSKAQHEGWMPVVWSYDSGRWSKPIELWPQDGRWHPIPMALTASGGIAAVERDDLAGGWDNTRGVHPDWNCDVVLVKFDAPRKSVPRKNETSGRDLLPLVMPNTKFRLTDRIAASSAKLPRQEAKHAARSLTLYWGDLHDHTDMSVCQRQKNPPVRENYQTKRDIERLDFTAITDHGYNLDPPQWAFCGEQVRANHDPGKFVTFLAEEWTSDHVPYDPPRRAPEIDSNRTRDLRRYGHHNIIFLDPHYPLFYDSRDGNITPKQVWDGIRNTDAVFIPHQLADLGNRPTDWTYHDEWHQPLAEIFQQRGSYEHLHAPLQAPRAMGVKGRYLQDAWAGGVVIGTIASPDHGGGRGKAGVWAGSLTREDLFKAFHARHSFGTTGSKIALLVTSGDHLMGDKVRRHDETPIPLRIRVVTDRPVAKVVVLRNNEVIYTKEPVEGEKELTVRFTDKAVPAIERLWYYIRIHRDDGQLAWSSPIWFLRDEPKR